MIDMLGRSLIWFFTAVPGVGTAMAFWIAVGLILTALLIAMTYRVRFFKPFERALAERNALISDRIGGGRSASDDARKAFSDSYFDIDEKMMEADHEEVFALRRAWEEYRETIIDPNSEVLRNSVRPEHFFLGLGERHKALGWFANIAIAVGLLFTFLGIIAALSTLDLSGGSEAMQSQLNNLMHVAGAKFWASVGGIVASIILRAVDYRFDKHVNEGLSKLCDLIEHGMAYLPPQRLASEQLDQLKEQTPALKGFSEQLAVVLEDALDKVFEKQFTPMVTSLGSIREGIDKISGDGGEAVSKAISQGAGAEMSGLADAIGAMTASLGTMAERLEKQTSSADQQIEEAVRRFGQASEEMREAFGDLNKNFAAVAERMRSDGEMASEQSRKRIDEMHSSFAELAERMRNDNAAAGNMAREQMESLISNLGTSLDDMRSHLAESGEAFGKQTSEAARQAAFVGQAALEEAFAEFSDRFREISGPLVEEMQKASTHIGATASSLDGSNRALGDYARGIESVAAKSSDIATALGTVAGDLREAVGPMRQTATSLQGSLETLSNAVKEDARNADANRQEMREMSERTRSELREVSDALQATGEAAEGAWSDYRARFNEVDKSLGEALNQLTEATSSHARNLNERVGQVDDALAKGITQLAAALRPLESLSDTVEDLSATLTERRTEAVS